MEIINFLKDEMIYFGFLPMDGIYFFQNTFKFINFILSKEEEENYVRNMMKSFIHYVYGTTDIKFPLNLFLEDQLDMEILTKEFKKILKEIKIIELTNSLEYICSRGSLRSKKCYFLGLNKKQFGELNEMDLQKLRERSKDENEFNLLKTFILDDYEIDDLYVLHGVRSYIINTESKKPKDHLNWAIIKETYYKGNIENIKDLNEAYKALKARHKKKYGK